MDGQAWTCVELLVANMAFEMLCLLVLNQNLLIVEFSIAIPKSIKIDKEQLTNTKVWLVSSFYVP